jgi:hypothetical protein
MGTLFLQGFLFEQRRGKGRNFLGMAAVIGHLQEIDAGNLSTADHHGYLDGAIRCIFAIAGESTVFKCSCGLSLRRC